ncbi:hypothetical protein [Nafulsella turpanensis]|uniref:hypothetical protein n=1 Tax=Nafulsella turpanensis TaxID=1265690 RepID=UPI00036E1AFB|nr:hypothetical protein [Nafulsella turpanensis]
MNHKDAQRDQVKQLRLLIRRELQSCNPSATPNFCEMIKTQSGYKKAESMTISYAITNGVGVGAAIAQLESEME